MEKINFMIFLSMLLAISYNQVLQASLPLKHPRKLQENINETILIGFDNYNYTAPYDFVYFNIFLYLKNWSVEDVEFMANTQNNNFTIDTVISYEKYNDTTKFTCINDYEWFGENYYSHYFNCTKKGFCIANYTCRLNITGKGIPRKINIITNFTNKDINDAAKISYVSSSAEALERDLVSLKYQTKGFKILKNVNFTSQSPNSFKIKADPLTQDYSNDYTYYYNDYYDSENIFLITTVNGSPKKIQCSGKYDRDSSDDDYYYFLQSKGSNNLAGANLSYALLNYTTKNNIMAILDFADNQKNANGTILPPKVDYKKKSGGLSTGGIIAIVIPAVLVLLGIGALAFFLSRRAVPSPPIKNIGNNTMGVVASSEAVVHQ